jgi:phosphohistidine phosphatase
MKTLLILRHAKSKPKDPDISDHDRELDERGKDDALRMGKLLRNKGLVPDFIMSSSALRARTTAEIVAEECEYKGEEKIALERSLYEAKPKDFMNLLNSLPNQYNRVLLVGHNPTIEETVQTLIDSLDSVIVIPTCAIAHLSIPIEKWSDLLKMNITKHQIVLKEILHPN